MKSWLVIQHVEWEPSGLIAEELQRAGHAFTVARMDRGDVLPPVDSIAGLIVMGGPMGVYEIGEHPYLRQEIDLLRQAANAGKPVLGVCLGSQLLATAFGSTVTRGPIFEIGIREVAFTSAGREDPVLGPGPTLPVMHWHQDSFDLPAGAILLASSHVYTHQAFRLSRRVYGLQFHFELDALLAAEWLPRLPAEYRFTESERARVETAGRELMRRFLAVTA